MWRDLEFGWAWSNSEKGGENRNNNNNNRRIKFVDSKKFRVVSEID